MIATTYIDGGNPVTLVLSAVGLSRSVYYYKEHPGRRGKTCSAYTRKHNGDLVANSVIVEDIKHELEKEFVDYGYLKMTYCLRDNYGYCINYKKVYRLMKEHNLLYKPLPRDRSGKTWVKDLKPASDKPFAFWEFDIKYMYVAAKQRNALQLTVLDVGTRYTMGQLIAWSIKKADVKELFAQIFRTYELPEAITVRNDNGSQFEAKLVREYLKKMSVTQEFCRPATPQQNGHVESYHSIVERSICKRYEFDSLEHLQATMKRFDAFYCNERIHSGIGYTNPRKYAIECGVNPKYLCKSGEAESGSAGEQPARNNLTTVDSINGAAAERTTSAPLNQPSLMPKKTQQSKVEYRSSF
jgi:transposase InsO family protein